MLTNPFNNSTITLTDLTGKIILVQAWNSTKEKIDLSDFAPGIYVLTISNEDEIIQGKMVKRN
ncbi:MAG: T9SS type A sorting domain-containing protein [Bacteroidetes bacterium]|nr:T9SS type A sorting domain-containing protein [Bacteroidota bacterium]